MLFYSTIYWWVNLFCAAIFDTVSSSLIQILTLPHFSFFLLIYQTKLSPLQSPSAHLMHICFVITDKEIPKLWLSFHSETHSIREERKQIHFANSHIPRAGKTRSRFPLCSFMLTASFIINSVWFIFPLLSASCFLVLGIGVLNA